MSAVLSVDTGSRPLRGTVIALALLAPFLLYLSTAQSIVSIWNRSDTFAHGYVILPICLWLAWQRRETLRGLAIKPFWPGFVLLALCGVGWMLAELGDVQIVKQYAFAAMLPLTVLAMLGHRMARSIAFALVFILFAVPFGEIFIPPLIDITANFTIAALRATGIPVLREGNTFSIPTGTWSVVEACSGLRYLIASFTLGTLYAHLTYRSRRRQVLFALLSILVPILANSGRAYMIVMMGHLSGMTLAVGADHLVYGWVFFGIVMFLLFWIGGRWREDHLHGEDPPPPAAASAELQPASTATLVAAALALLVGVGVWPLWASHIERSEARTAMPSLQAPPLAWAPAAQFADWNPSFDPPAARLQQFYQQDGRLAGLSLLYYRNQHPGARLITSTNALTVFGTEWRDIDSSARTEIIDGRALGLREGVIADTRGKMLVWHWYRIDRKNTRSDYVGKAWQVAQRVMHGSDDGAAVLVFSRFDEHPEAARTTLRAFLAANLAPIEAALDRQQGH